MAFLDLRNQPHGHRREESSIAPHLAKEQMEKMCQKGKDWQSHLRKIRMEPPTQQPKSEQKHLRKEG
jgi:hypothetical protein